MSPDVLMDSNVFISFKYEQDVNHQRATEVLGKLRPFPQLTEVAAYEVVEITRSKLNSVIERIFKETSVLKEKTSTKKKLKELGRLIEELETEANLGTFLKVVRDFCVGELEKGRTTLDHLVEWASDQVNRMIKDIQELCRVTAFDRLPSKSTDEDYEFIKDCADILDVDYGTKDRDTQILWDALAYARFSDDVVLITFDKSFVKKATKMLACLTDNSISVSKKLRAIDINDGDVPS